MSRQSAMEQYTAAQVWPVFEALLPANRVLAWVAQAGRRFYQRVYTPWVVLWGFICQRLQADHTCDAFVSDFVSGQWPGLYSPTVGRERPSENSAAYCQARQRLPLSVAWQALRQTAQAISEQLGPSGLWHGRRVALLDGSTLRLSAEEALVAHYGLPKGQHGSSHWPRLRTVAAFDVCSGALCEVVEGPYAQSEYELAIQLLRAAQPGMVWVGDQLFGIYHLVQVVAACRQEAVFRIQAGHIGRWGAKHWPSGSDRHVVWQPSASDQREADLPAASIPGRLLYLRVVRDGFKPFDVYLFTTLTDRQQYPAEAILALYARRWQVELHLRHVKTTFSMELLMGKSVDIIRKELALGLVAYNLIRGLMAQAAVRAGLSPLALSFARCWRRIVAATQCGRNPSAHSGQDADTVLLERLAACRLPVRPQPRLEPRAVWPKPHKYPYMTRSRQEARQRSRQKLMTNC
jgi:hypothetical protein